MELVRTPDEITRRAIAIEFVKMEENALLRAINSYESEKSDREESLKVVNAIWCLETTKLWVLKEAVERLLSRRSDLAREFEHSFGIGGDCSEGEHLSRISYRTALRMYINLSNLPPDSPLCALTSKWFQTALDLELSEAGEIEFLLLDELQLEACRFYLSEYVRECLVLESLPPASKLKQ